ncbi:MAG: hypothetical protein ACR2M2_04780 [Gaiellaceae bacterium]
MEQLRKVGDYVRKGWRSTADDSYREYKHGRERERKQAEREREYEERYAAERAAEEPQPEAPRDDTSKPE